MSGSCEVKDLKGWQAMLRLAKHDIKIGQHSQDCHSERAVLARDVILNEQFLRSEGSEGLVGDASPCSA